MTAVAPPPASAEVTVAPPDDLTRSLRRRSGGNVVDVRPSGPLFGNRCEPTRTIARGTFVKALDPSDRLLVAGLTLGWLVCLALFWTWWLQPAHRVSWLGLAVNSTVLLHLSVMPVYFLIGVNRLERVSPQVAVPMLRVAFVVTRAPSEPWDVARRTLRAMLDQDYPHGYDVWLCDESPTAEIRQWCAANHVGVSTRLGVAAYHRDHWPRRTRTKEGNLAYFYDHVGYEWYDVVAQLDCDHVPTARYLAEMVRPFADGAIGYVAAPSVCDTDAAASWSARGRLHREAAFHGPAQLGHSAGLAPACIGSHYAVRTAALREIGGIGPELAEDFTTSFLLTSAGWHGAFAIDAEAHGDGPRTFPAMLVQEFQWSRSLTAVLWGLVPRHLGRMPWKLRLRFAYALTYYPLLATTTVGGLALAPYAAVTGVPWIDVHYLDFLLRWWSISVWVVVLVLLMRRRGLLRPLRAPIVSWENCLYCLTRWPLVVRGVLAGTLQQIRPRPTTFRVTPKGAGSLEPLPLRLMAPYLLVCLVLSGASLYAESFTDAAGYVFLCLLGAVTYGVVSIVVPVLHAVECGRAAGLRFAAAARRTVLVPLVVGVVTAMPVGLAVARYPAYFVRVFG
jgi:cellulose synthase/poly-beta-1,6-N-acetylglucosamine synthase-like glycosyltransferase